MSYATEEPLLGTSIEDYAIGKLLGKGGFASVYEAVCLKTGRKVAIKMIDKKLMKEAKLQERVSQEVLIHLQMKHPSILELYTSFEDNNYVYLVLELCVGGEFQKYLKGMSEPLTEERVQKIFRQVVEGLLYLHSRRIIHRDLTLANLLLSEDMQTVKISDFGLATKLNKAEDKHLTMCGTPNYISPEVITRSSHGLETDVWGLGCMLYTLLVGKPPFDTDAVKSTLTKVVMADFKIPDHVSSEARDLISVLLKKNPKHRIKLRNILRHSFMKKNFEQEKWLTHDSGLCTMSSRSGGVMDQTTSSRLQSPVVLHPSNHLPNKFSPIFPNSPALAEEIPEHDYHHSCTPMLWPSSLVSTPLPSRPVHPCLPNDHQPLSIHDRCFCCVSKSHCSNHGHSERLVPHYQQNLPQYSTVSRAASEPTRCRASEYCHHPSQVYCSHNGVMPVSAQASCSQSILSHGDSCPVMSYHSQVAQQSSVRSVNNAQECITTSVHKDKGVTLLPYLNTSRLKAIRHRSRNIMYTILASGEVVLEFIKKYRNNSEKVTEVWRISSDGMRIVAYRPNNRMGCTVGKSPPDMPLQGADFIYSYESLPEKFYYKYNYAARFVDMVKSTTPRIVVFFDKAKCVLMENKVTFDARFYQGETVARSTSSWRIIEQNGAARVLAISGTASNLTTTQKNLWDYAQQCLQHCKELESCLSQVEAKTSDKPCFPIVIGGRKHVPPASNAAKEKDKNLSQTQASLYLKAHSILSTNTTSNMQSQQLPHEDKALKEAYVPGIGIAYQISPSEIQVHYNGLTRFVVDIQNRVIKHITREGDTQIYKSVDAMPYWLINRVDSFPTVVEYLSLPKDTWSLDFIR